MNCTKKLEGLRNEKGDWSRNGHPERLLLIGKEEIRLLALLFEDKDKNTDCKLPSIHTKSMLDVLKLFAFSNKKIGDLKNNVFASMMFDETNSQKKGIIKFNVNFPSSYSELILSGPHIYIGNPLYKASKSIVRTNTDFINIDLNNVNDAYIQRCNYSIKDKSLYDQSIQMTSWNTRFVDEYRFMNRKMINLTQERTLIGSIMPKGVNHINAISSLAFKRISDLLNYSVGCISLPFDFFIKLYGKTNFTSDSAYKLPLLIENNYLYQAVNHLLRLNCVNSSFEELWNKGFKEIDYLWSKNDDRLSNASLSKIWNREYALLNDFERRQALLEIDVLVALNLGMTIDQLVYIYEMQFPVFAKYEDDTWYDANGRIVFSAKNYGNLIYSRQEFEQIKNAKAGEKFYRTISDDTMPGGPVERTIEYVAPFDKCDRIQDYKQAWEFFSKKYGRSEE